MRHNILIVDDEQLIRQGLRARIEYLGIDVDEIFEAENGLMALRLQEEHPIDVVITDIRMEGMDGCELIEKIREQDKDCAIIVISCLDNFEILRKMIPYKRQKYPEKKVLLLFYYTKSRKILDLFCDSYNKNLKISLKNNQTIKKNIKYDK